MTETTEQPHAAPEGHAERPEPPHRCGLTPGQYSALLAPIDPGRVMVGDMGPLRGKSYVESWDIRRHLNRVFGFTGWGTTLDAPTMAFEEQREDGKWEVCYIAIMTLEVRCTCGRYLTSHSDATAGSGAALPSRAGAHDLALKSAVSGALKRAAVNLGDMFGLSLYEPTLVTGRTDTGRLVYAPAVRRTLSPPPDMTPGVSPDVTAGRVTRDTVTSGEDAVTPDTGDTGHVTPDVTGHAGDMSPDMDVTDTPDTGDIPRGDMSPEDRAAGVAPDVPAPVDMDTAIGIVQEVFDGAGRVDAREVTLRPMTQAAVDAKVRFVSRAQSLKTLRAQYVASVPDAPRMTAAQVVEVGQAFDAAYRRIAGVARPGNVADWLTDAEMAGARQPASDGLVSS